MVMEYQREENPSYLSRCGLVGAILRYEGITRTCGAIDGSCLADTESGSIEGDGPYDIGSGFESGKGMIDVLEPDGLFGTNW